MKSARLIVVVLQILFLNSSFSQEGWISLFDGKSLDGWKASENPSSFKVENGMIIASGERAHLFYTGRDGGADFKNFEFEVEFMTAPHANSGVYFHTAYQEKGFPGRGFEVQIHNSPREVNGYRENKLSGSLYGIRNVYKPLAEDEKWNKFRIVVKGKRVQIYLNDISVVDYVEPNELPMRGTRPGKRLDHGTFAFQCHDPESKVWFRNIRVKRFPDDAVSEKTPKERFTDYEIEIIRLGGGNYPVINLHAHLKGGLMIEDLLEQSKQSGVFYGVAVNCGLNFAITNDVGIESFLNSMKGKPVFIGMQAEGREWVNLFSKDAIKKFDYVFTDAMTIFDNNGKRMRLWIPEEVGEIKNKEAFMEMLVEKTVQILNTEPIDIYVNPTYLPDQIAKDYDVLWTEQRMQKVISAAAKNKIAIEINSRLKLPSPKFLKLAKEAGCKFTFGTNNADRNIGDLEYCFQMVKELGLKWQDIWVPTLKEK
ncbi:MAG: DUF1080 domain-containing protein [Verrucomicrobiae bacterium]|nr:DUF1080 domain-containing protein [Verrucomicrobiae bacterium]